MPQSSSTVSEFTRLRFIQERFSRVRIFCCIFVVTSMVLLYACAGVTFLFCIKNHSGFVIPLAMICVATIYSFAACATWYEIDRYFKNAFRDLQTARFRAMSAAEIERKDF